MIAAIFSNPWLVIFIMGGAIFMSFVCILNTLYLCRYLPEILKALERCRQVNLNVRIFQYLGVFGKVCLIYQISGMLIWPKLEIRGGFLDAEDVAGFPPHLLRLLKINMAFMVFGTIWFIVACVVLELR